MKKICLALLLILSLFVFASCDPNTPPKDELDISDALNSAPPVTTESGDNTWGETKNDRALFLRSILEGIPAILSQNNEIVAFLNDSSTTESDFHNGTLNVRKVGNKTRATYNDYVLEDYIGDESSAPKDLHIYGIAVMTTSLLTDWPSDGIMQGLLRIRIDNDVCEISLDLSVDASSKTYIINKILLNNEDLSKEIDSLMNQENSENLFLNNKYLSKKHK